MEVLSRRQEELLTIKNKVYASDINPVLIYFYKNVQRRPRKVIAEIKKVKETFDECPDVGDVNRKAKTLEEAQVSKESFYYYVRSIFNSLKKSTAKASAYFLFLNKTCWRGVYREGPNGFNVPYGHYINPGIFDDQEIMETSKLIKDVEFTECSFIETLKKPKKGDFVYLDPPYVPVTRTSFVGYTAEGFGAEMHISLFEDINSLTDKGVKIVMSNSNASVIRDALPEDKFVYVEVSVRRSINSKDPSVKAEEIIVKS